MEKCGCYFEDYDRPECWGTKERDVCSCGGDKTKCNFYPEIKEEALNKSKMKIYQIHECGGEWENHYDHIVASYLSEEKAIAEKERLEIEETEAGKCHSCPLYYCQVECEIDVCGSKECKQRSIDMTKEYCKRYEPDEDYEDSKLECKNFSLLRGDSCYRIEIVEVIE